MLRGPISEAETQRHKAIVYRFLLRDLSAHASFRNVGKLRHLPIMLDMNLLRSVGGIQRAVIG